MSYSLMTSSYRHASFVEDINPERPLRLGIQHFSMCFKGFMGLCHSYFSIMSSCREALKCSTLFWMIYATNQYSSTFFDNWEIVTHVLIANLNVCLQKQIKHFHLIELLVAKMQNVSKLQTSAILKIDDAAMAKVLLSGIFRTLQPLYLVA